MFGCGRLIAWGVALAIRVRVLVHIHLCIAYLVLFCVSCWCIGNDICNSYASWCLYVCLFSCWSSEILAKAWGVVLVLFYVDVYVLENIFVIDCVGSCVKVWV